MIIAIQVGAEEIMFRNIIINYFIVYGSVIAITISVLTFVLVQAFQMNAWEAAIFPMTGALVMGVVHAFLYLQVPLIWPLVLAHVTFFLCSTL